MFLPISNAVYKDKKDNNYEKEKKDVNRDVKGKRANKELDHINWFNYRDAKWTVQYNIRSGFPFTCLIIFFRKILM